MIADVDDQRHPINDLETARAMAVRGCYSSSKVEELLLCTKSVLTVWEITAHIITPQQVDDFPHNICKRYIFRLYAEAKERDASINKTCSHCCCGHL